MALAVIQVYERYAELSISGELDLAVERELQHAWLEALAGRPQALLVDLTAVSLFDNCGVRLVVSGCRCSRDQGTAVAILISPGSHASRVLELIGLHMVLPLYHDRGAALASLWLHQPDLPMPSAVPESAGDRLATSPGFSPGP